MKTLIKPIVAALVFSFSLAMASVSAQVVYSEYFTNETTSNQSLAWLGWECYYGSSATVGDNGRAVINMHDGNPNDPAGYMWVTASAVSQGASNVVCLTEFDSSISLMGDGTTSIISFSFASTQATVSVRLMVKVNGQWYASDTYFTTTSSMTEAGFEAASTEDVTKSLTFTLDASAWREVTLTPGSALSISSTTLESDLTSSDIDGIGFYLENSHQNWGSSNYIDTLEVTTAAIPEASSSAWLLGGVTALLCLWKRNRVGC